MKTQIANVTNVISPVGTCLQGWMRGPTYAELIEKLEELLEKGNVDESSGE